MDAIDRKDPTHIDNNLDPSDYQITKMPNPYVEYPRHMHHATEKVRVVNSDVEREQALDDGWTLQPGEPPRQRAVPERLTVIPDEEVAQAAVEKAKAILAEARAAKAAAKAAKAKSEAAKAEAAKTKAKAAAKKAKAA